jgi:hypothetical protein
VYNTVKCYVKKCQDLSSQKHINILRHEYLSETIEVCQYGVVVLLYTVTCHVRVNVRLMLYQYRESIRLTKNDVREALLHFASTHCCYGKAAARECDVTEILAASALHVRLELHVTPCSNGNLKYYSIMQLAYIEDIIVMLYNIL